MNKYAKSMMLALVFGAMHVAQGMGGNQPSVAQLQAENAELRQQLAQATAEKNDFKERLESLRRLLEEKKELYHVNWIF